MRYSGSNHSSSTNLIPDTKAWKLIRFQESTDKKSVLIEVKFDRVQNFNGLKILLFRNCTLVDLINQKEIDPHFLNNNKLKYPIARFSPTEEGWKMGMQCINMISYTGIYR